MAASKAFTSAGTKLYMSATLPATYDITGYAALSWTEIGEISDLGEFGRQYNLVNFNPLGDRRTVKRKGSYNDGTIAAQMARVPTDAGQAMLVTALGLDVSRAIKIVLQDGTIFYTTVQVMSYTTNVGSVDQITAATVNMEIDTDIIED